MFSAPRVRTLHFDGGRLVFEKAYTDEYGEKMKRKAEFLYFLEFFTRKLKSPRAKRASRFLLVAELPPQASVEAASSQKYFLNLKGSGAAVYTLAFSRESSANFRSDFLSPRAVLRVFKILMLYGFSEVHLHFSGQRLRPRPSVDRLWKYFLTRLLQQVLLFYLRIRFRKKLYVIHPEKNDTSKPKSPVLAKKPRILFIMAWFGPRARGGAEFFAMRFMQELAARGVEFEMWSTASSTLSNWNNDCLNDDDCQLGFKIRRFPSQNNYEEIFHHVHELANRKESMGWWNGRKWQLSNLFGIGMEEALEAAESQFDVIYLFHYLSGTAHRLSGLFPCKTIVHPFIHDEPPLYQPMMRDLFAGARGVICNSPAEVELASKAECGLLPELFFPMGNGVELREIPEVEPIPAILDDLSPRSYVVYVGRMVEGKNLDELLQWHRAAFGKLTNPPVLVMIGEGPFSDKLKENAASEGIRWLGWLADNEKMTVVKHSLALIQPSLFESFSLVMMEAWLQKIPVIVHEKCLATKLHVDLCRGGIAVEGTNGYCEAIAYMQKNSDQWQRMAQQGYDYVKERFTWEKVITRFLESVQKILAT